VTLPKEITFRLGIAKAAPETKQFVAANRGSGTKISDSFRRRLLNDRHALFKIECRQALVAGLKLIKIDGVCRLLVTLYRSTI
jgi:hypothetical protein